MSDAAVTIQRLLADAEQLPDPQARVLARALAAAMVTLLADAIRRVLELGPPELARKLADDALVGDVLVLCGMHPNSAVTRARDALEAASAELGAIGIALQSVDEVGQGVCVRVTGGTESPERVNAMLETIILARAPDLERIQIELGTKPVTTPEVVAVRSTR